jgi:hypothetical protein
MLIWRAVGYTNAQEEANSFFNYGFIPQNLGRPRTERFIGQRWRQQSARHDGNWGHFELIHKEEMDQQNNLPTPLGSRRLLNPHHVKPRENQTRHNQQTQGVVNSGTGVIKKTHERWKNLCGKGSGYVSEGHGFWLNAPGCKGQ